MSTSAQQPSLQSPDDLVPVAQYAERRKHLFPGTESIRWFMRNHRDALVESGAVLMIAGRWFANPQAFDRAVIDAGQQAARRSAR